MGYTSDDIWLDAIWLQRLAATSPQGFKQLTNFRIPDCPRGRSCRICRECSPQRSEETYFSSDGEAVTHTHYICVNTNGEYIRAMTTAPQEPPRVYRSSMTRPLGLISRPVRINGEGLCLYASTVKAYALPLMSKLTEYKHIHYLTQEA